MHEDGNLTSKVIVSVDCKSLQIWHLGSISNPVFSYPNRVLEVSWWYRMGVYELSNFIRT
jgi:hypothetical protein